MLDHNRIQRASRGCRGMIATSRLRRHNPELPCRLRRHQNSKQVKRVSSQSRIKAKVPYFELDDLDLDMILTLNLQFVLRAGSRGEVLGSVRTVQAAL